jgi:CheY-like chemotaxis protein
MSKRILVVEDQLDNRQLLLIVVEPPHHGPLPSRIASPRRNH